SLDFLSAVLFVSGQYNYDSYKSLANGQYQDYPTYQSNLGTCNDLLCSPNECCVETHRAPVCVALVT
ncbi:hypothetical protein BgiMline_016878, partial [Biomphalaria glabrata]